MTTRSTLHLLVVLGSLVASAGCAFFTLETPCDADNNCPFGRVCSTAKVCVVSDGAEGEGSAAEGEGEGSAGEGEGEGAVPCEGVSDVENDISIPGDEARLAPAGNTCVHVHGGVQVGNVSTLAAFARVQVIGGDFQIEGSSIVDFEGCNQLTTINGQMRVRNNPNLDTFNGLDELTSVGDGFDFSGNPLLSEGEISDFKNRF